MTEGTLTRAKMLWLRIQEYNDPNSRDRRIKHAKEGLALAIVSQGLRPVGKIEVADPMFFRLVAEEHSLILDKTGEPGTVLVERQCTQEQASKVLIALKQEAQAP